jgi:poly(glycerol-phosphate) alpha-glucosyltransferase
VWKSLRLYIPKRLGAVLKDKVASADLIHSHGLWAPANVIAAGAARKAHLPHIIAPRGSFEPVALAKSAWKKAIFKRLYVNRALRQAACFHALTEREAWCIREFGLANPIAIVPNAVACSQIPDGRNATDGRGWAARLGGQKLIVFLGRMHPIKGLDILIEAWRRIAGEFSDWHLVLAGPDEDGYLAAIESQVDAADLADRVSFPGELYGRDKDALLAAADLFVLPSRSEAMSVALLEAMAARLPVVITDTCNFPAAEDSRAGFVVEPDVESLAAGLAQILKTPDDQRAEMGARGASLVGGKYSWDSVAREMLEVYRWVLGLREAPQCVRMD